MAKKDIESGIEEGKKVMPQEYVEVEYTDKAAFGTKGQKVKVHKIQAEKLVKKGFATYVK